MKIGVLTNAFCERDLIAGCIDQFKGRFVHTALVSQKPWHGDWEPDDTHVIALKHGAHVEVGTWASASEQLNYGLSLFRGFDWVIICDADERYTQEGIDLLVADFIKIQLSGIDAGGVRTQNWSVYWKSPQYRIIPDQTDYPLIAIRPGQSFGHIRSFNGTTAWSRCHMHHFSYVRDDQQMLKKIQSFDASTEFDPVTWYENVWLKWTPEMENLHPVVPEQFKKAVDAPCPQELLEFLP